MREIKIRAWDGKSMYAPWHLNWIIQGKGTPPRWMDADHRIKLWPPDTTFVQYTGLKDKNGVEIYEGDVIRLNDIKNIAVTWGGSHGSAFFGLGDMCLIAPSSPAKQGLTYEVIGNIYENPALLLEKAS